ncbi:MAG: MBL fold metallo-hydrolase RNA specificity domain-containing protein [Planctomycetota bacterium]|jgi:metallo-beta-lactamase family protein
MRLHFLGANRQVTGSRYVLEVGDRAVMIDCGMVQERKYLHRNWEPCPFDVNRLDAVVLTHAHFDHTGWLPKLVKEGYGGTIWATDPTLDLAAIILKDSAKIQREDAKYKEKRHKKEGRRSKYGYDPLYTDADVQATLNKMKGVGYGEEAPVTEGVRVSWREAGHILGSASLEVVAEEEGQTRRLVFSGDLGQHGKPIIRDPDDLSGLEAIDYVIMESTYGDRDHKDFGDVEYQLQMIIHAAVERGGKLVIPTFAIERAQELLWYLAKLNGDNLIPRVPVFLDSPMAIDATEIFRKHRDYYDGKTMGMIEAAAKPLSSLDVKFTRSVEESKAINDLAGPAIVMASSGMCTGGRIKHHLANYVGDPDCTVLFVGYQANGSLGRQIVSGKEKVRIFGVPRKVNAHVEQVYGFSAHGDRGDLLEWLGSVDHKPRRVFLTHGDEQAALSLGGEVAGQLGMQADVPEYGDVVELI